MAYSIYLNVFAIIFHVFTLHNAVKLHVFPLQNVAALCKLKPLDYEILAVSDWQSETPIHSIKSVRIAIPFLRTASKLSSLL